MKSSLPNRKDTVIFILFFVAMFAVVSTFSTPESTFVDLLP